MRPVYFPRVDGDMEWTTASGDVINANFQDELTKDQMSMRLRTALSLEGEWMPSVMARANEQLRSIRQEHREAGGLVIAIDQDHAQGIARLLRDRFGVPADVVISDDPTASKKIAEFSHNDRPWLVAVRMVSEGVDIPRLRVGVFATTTSTELFFRQAVGRFVRWQSGRPSQKAYVYIPDDPRLRTHAFEIAEARRHILRPPGSDDADDFTIDGGLDDQVHPDDAAEQLTLFSVVSSTATDITVHTVTEDGVRYEPLFDLTAARYDDDIEIPEPSFVADPSLQPRPPRGADRGRARAERLAQRRRTQGRPAHPQCPRGETPRRHHGLGPRQGPRRDEPARRRHPGGHRHDRPARTASALLRELAAQAPALTVAVVSDTTTPTPATTGDDHGNGGGRGDRRHR